MIIVLKDTLDSVLNHKQMGKVSTDEFNAILPQVIADVQSNLFSQFRKLNYKRMRFQETSNYGNETQYVKQAMEHFITEKEVELTEGKADISDSIDDFLLINSVFSEKAEVEKTDLLVFNKISKIEKMAPTNCMPIYTLNGTLLKTIPKTEKVDVVYFRKAKTPKLTSRIVGETEVYYDGSQDFQDIDMHPIMLQAIFIEMLAYFGINLQDQFAMQMSAQLKQEEHIEKQ